MTKDTALFQGLARAVQYGDFVAKAILYEHLTKGKTKATNVDALAQVSKAFIEYNKVSGRTRQYIESVGLGWFWNYKLRIMNEAAYLLRHHPLKALMISMVPPLIRKLPFD